MPDRLLDRFFRYVKIDTQSDPSSDRFPSTEKQKDLSRLLVEELLEMGIQDAELDPYGYVYATVPATTEKEVPVICFCSHVDTSPDCSGSQVKPLLHKNYDGRHLVLPDDSHQVLRMAEHPDLKNQMGNDIITASGATLLGADNKAGVAAIMNAVDYWQRHPEVKHGAIRILFTPDEEIGRGVDKVDMQRLGADFGYTVDGAVRGSLEDETFCADAVTLRIQGVSTHPGFALGKLESALKIAADILYELPRDTLSPETTQGKEGFVHPVQLAGTVESARLEFIIRDFSTEGLRRHEDILRAISDKVMQSYPGSRHDIKVTEQYRNMKEVLDKYPQVVEYAEEAIRRAGMEPLRGSIRGGTDGSRLSFMGLPCPNIFAGEQAFHSHQEWVSLQDMEKSTETIIQLAQIWEEHA